MLFISQAAEESIPVIQELAEKTWAVAYASILPPAQINFEALAQILERGSIEPNIFFKLALYGFFVQVKRDGKPHRHNRGHQ